MPIKFDDELTTYLQPGPYSLVVANADPAGIPEAVRAWGPRINGDRRTVDVFVGREPSRRLVENFAHDDRMSLSIANVTTYQALQLKGHCIEIGDAEPEDIVRVQRHGEAFVAGTALIGIREQASRGMLVRDVIRLTFAPEALFDQTPGPDAGIVR